MCRIDNGFVEGEVGCEVGSFVALLVGFHPPHLVDLKCRGSLQPNRTVARRRGGPHESAGALAVLKHSGVRKHPYGFAHGGAADAHVRCEHRFGG